MNRTELDKAFHWAWQKWKTGRKVLGAEYWMRRAAFKYNVSFDDLMDLCRVQETLLEVEQDEVWWNR